MNVECSSRCNDIGNDTVKWYLGIVQPVTGCHRFIQVRAKVVDPWFYSIRFVE